MDVLAEHVGRRVDLEVIEVQVTGHQIGRLIHDAFPGLRAEEQRLGGSLARKGSFDVLLQHRDSRLWIVPTRFVDRHIELYIGRPIDARELVIIEFLRTRIGVGGARLGAAAAVHAKHDVLLLWVIPVIALAGRIAGGVALSLPAVGSRFQIIQPQLPVRTGGGRRKQLTGMEIHRLLFVGTAVIAVLVRQKEIEPGGLKPARQTE